MTITPPHIEAQPVEESTQQSVPKSAIKPTPLDKATEQLEGLVTPSLLVLGNMEQMDAEKYSISKARDLAMKINKNLILTSEGDLKHKDGNHYHENKWMDVREPNFRFQVNPSIEISVEEYRVAAYANDSKMPANI